MIIFEGQHDPILIGGTMENNINHVRPWVRYLARMIDIWLFLFIVSFSGLQEIEFNLNIPSLIIVPINIFVWLLIESVLLATVGTTLGKWLLKINILNNQGEKLTINQSLKRSLNLFWRGLGLGIPIVYVATAIISFYDLTKVGVTYWDLKSNIMIKYEKIGKLRVFMTIILCLIILYGLAI